MNGDKVDLSEIMVTPDLAADPRIDQLIAQISAGPTAVVPPPAAPAPIIAAPTDAGAPLAPQYVAAVANPITSTAPAAAPTAASPALVPKGLEGVGLTAEQVNAAIDHGRDFLWTYLQDTHRKAHSKTLVYDAPDMLAALALVHAGAHKKIPEFDAQLRDFLKTYDIRAQQCQTYECGLYCLLVEAYADPIFEPKLRDAARYLIEFQGKDGSWNYGVSLPATVFKPPVINTALAVYGGSDPDSPDAGLERINRITDWSDKTQGDNSTSQFAILGLRAGADCRYVAQADTWTRNLAAYRARQCKDGSWGYNAGASAGYGSMTCAGICADVIDRYELGDQDPAQDPQVTRGLKWLGDHFSVNTNPNYESRYLYYYLYSLERVGRLLDTEFIGNHEWYPLGAQFLVKAQKPDGRWVESQPSEDPRLATSFALLFLTRATATLRPSIQHHGSGELHTALATIPPARLYIILDASGSMLEEMDGKMKFDLAKDAVRAMLALLGPNSQVGMRVYGHRKRAIEPGADEDTELVIPMGPYDPKKFETVLQGLRSKGKTPLALSLEDAEHDIGAVSQANPITVVLLTDGGEDTRKHRDPVEVAKELGTKPGVDFHIIGFDINEEDWATQLKAMAQAGNGHYWPAPHPGDLQRTLRAALEGDPEAFLVLDSGGTEAFTGRFGDSRRFPEGKYTLVTQFEEREFRQPFWINTNSTTVVTFDAAKAAADSTAKPAGDPIKLPPATTPAPNP